MMNKEEWKKAFYNGLSGFIALAMTVILYFVVLRFSELKSFLGWIIGILMPFIYGGVLAYLLKTPCNFFDNFFEKKLPSKQKKYARMLSVVVVLLLTVAILYLLLWMVIPEVGASIAGLIAAMPKQIERLTDWLIVAAQDNEMVRNYLNAENLTALEDKFIQWIQTDLLTTLANMMGGVAATVSSIVGTVSDIVIGIVVCVYLLLSRKTFARQGKAILYAIFDSNKADAVVNEFKFIDRTFVGFFGGKILDSAIIGAICYIFCLIMTLTMDFKNAMLISVIIGVTNIIPYFGPFIGAIPAALLILISSPVNCVIFLVFIIILQQFDGNILGPKLLANSVGLSGFWVLFSITLFGGLFGFVGILIGVPVFAVIYDNFKSLIYAGLKKNGRMDVLQGTQPVVEESKKKPTEN